MTTEATGECPTCGTPYPEYMRAVRALLDSIYLGDRECIPRQFWKNYDTVEDMTVKMEKAHDQG